MRLKAFLVSAAGHCSLATTHSLPTAAVSPAAQHWLKGARGFSCGRHVGSTVAAPGLRAWLQRLRHTGKQLCSLWALPGPGTELRVSCTGGFFTTEASGSLPLAIWSPYYASNFLPLLAIWLWTNYLNSLRPGCLLCKQESCYWPHRSCCEAPKKSMVEH